MPRQIFKKCVIAVAGPLPGQLTVENLVQWTRIRKGIFSNDFDEFVTHLLCTREQFNKRVPRVQQALKRGKRFHIVHYDWFEFSAVQEKKQSENEYSMRVLLAKQKAREREERRIEKGIQNEEKFVNTSKYKFLAYLPIYITMLFYSPAAFLTNHINDLDLFHIYTDREFFSYQIDITRDDTGLGELGQRYTMCLWESDAKPHLYQFTAKFLKRKGDGQPTYYRPSPCAGKWRDEMNHFMAFFQKKTGVDWEDRVVMQKTTDTEYFQYTPPAGGKPVGRRLRHSHEYCLQINAELRGLPWPPKEENPEGMMDVTQGGDILAIPGGSDEWEPEIPADVRNDSLVDEDMDTSDDETPPSTQDAPDGEQCEEEIANDDSDEDVHMETETPHQSELEDDEMDEQPSTPSSDDSTEGSTSQQVEDGYTTPTSLASDYESSCSMDPGAMVPDEITDPRFYEAVRQALKFPVPN
ncbi:unnamed protein product [Clonostachys byssicola]|uniref:BRCT domain-containing protein n=1 Tax=Clonostachys byssicola TaxID=160290 RepID=A0A9N9Y4R3_9HYPO|nr:unnamed protein product [Clonostachys byssicola]